MINFIVSEIKENELQTALDLVKKVFMKFEAPEYSEQGVITFEQFINYYRIKRSLADGIYKMWVCKDDCKIIGVIALRGITHISLFFVDESYHRKGVGKLMFNTALSYVKTKGSNKLTVNSSPYAVEVYHHLGFIDTDKQRVDDGITYTPMVYNFS